MTSPAAGCYGAHLVRLRSSTLPRLGVVLLVSSACAFDLDVGAPNYIDHARVLGIRVQAVELAPIWPERVGFDPDDAPIVEALPGDRVRLASILVDAEGQALAAADYDAIWWQCEADSCAADLPRCDEIEWTSDSACELGRGGQFEFIAPPPGPGLADHIGLMGIVAHDPEADAESCRQGLLDGTTALSKCTIILGAAPLGPRWAMLYDAAQSGLEVDIPLTEIPWAAFEQPANRAPAPAPPSFIDDATGVMLEGTPPRVRAGQRVISQGPQWRLADVQPFVVAKEVVEFESYVFIASAEGLGIEWFSSGPLHAFQAKHGGVVIDVDAFADPGLARVVAVFGDSRLALDFRVYELEVVP